MAYEFPSALWPIETGDRSAESHLNALKEITAAIDFGWWMQNRIWDAGTTGAIAYSPVGNDSLIVEATGTPSMQVKVLQGAGFLAGIPFRKAGDTTISALTAPVSEPRIDTIGIDPTDGSVTVYTGVENASPTAPAVASGIFKAGEIYLRVGSTAIYDSPQSTGGYIQNLRDVFSLPGDAPHTSGLTVSGGAFVHDGSSGDITLPAAGLSIEFDYAGENTIDASNAAGFLAFRTGGTTDRLTLGTPANPIILHGSSHDLKLSANGESLISDGPNRLILEQTNGTGFEFKTDSTSRLTLDEDGILKFLGSSANITLPADGLGFWSNYAGAFVFKATNDAGSFWFTPGNDAAPGLIIASGLVQFVGSGGTICYDGAQQIVNESTSEAWVFNQTSADDGIILKTNSVSRYQINKAGVHTIWGDAYFQNDVYIAGTLFIDGVPVTGDDLPGGSAFGTITIPGTVFEPASSGGSDGADSAEFGSNVLLFQLFNASTDGYCMAPNMFMPLNYNDTQTVHVRVRWSANDTTTNVARFSLQTAPQGDGDAANQALNTATTIDDANESVANQMHVTPWTAISMTGIAAGDHFALRLDRLPTHANDTLAAAVRVHSVDIRYTRGTT